jgi:alpha-galactosidase
MFGVIGSRPARRGILAGFLSQKQGFGAFDVRLRRRGASMRLWMDADSVRIDPGAYFLSDWACIQFVDLDDPDPLSAYLDAVGRLNNARTTGAVPVGWCSWYQHFQDVTEEDVLRSMYWARDRKSEVPLDVIQIDDGYQAEVGDWLTRDAQSFPSGMDQLAERIAHTGFTPGIWLAPFIAKPGAEVLREHGDWILRRADGRPTPSGFIWDTFPRTLDVTHPGVQAHIRRVVRTAVEDWGYRYLKLDFLYAGALPGSRFDPTKTRAQALHQALELLRETAGEDVTLVGCGCPLGSGVGVFDSMRIGPDVAPHWHAQYRGLGFLLRNEPGIPSLRAALQTSLSRAHLHRRWWINDVDCLLLRAEDTSLTPSEVQTLATVAALSGGALMVSDGLSKLSQERFQWLQRLLPPLPQAAQIVDWFDAPRPSTLVLPLESEAGTWWLIAAVNWADAPQDLMIDLPLSDLDDESNYHGVDFWGQRYLPVFQDRLLFKSVPAHGVGCAAVRAAALEPAWIGDTLHVSQGLGIRQWTLERSGLKLYVDYGRALRGRAWLQLPAEPTSVTLKGVSQPWRQVASDVFAIYINASEGGELRMRWK